MQIIWLVVQLWDLNQTNGTGELFTFDESSRRASKMAFGGRNGDQVVCGYLSYDHIHITGATSYALGRDGG